MNRLSQIFSQQLPLLTQCAIQRDPEAAAPPTIVRGPQMPPPPGIEIDHQLETLPTPPPPPHLEGLLPTADELPPPLPPELQHDTTFTPLLHDFNGLASGALGALVNRGGAFAAAKLAIPLLKDVQKMASSSKPEDAAHSPLGHLLLKEADPTAVPPAPTRDDLRRTLLGH